MTETVTRFPMGADIPEWLLTVEPRPDVPNSQRGNFRFAVDADVIDTEASYVVIPRTPGDYQGVFDMSGCVGCLIFPPGKTVSVALALQHYFMPETASAWKPMGPNGQIMLPPPPSPPMQAVEAHQSGTGMFGQPPAPVQPVPDPYRTFWQRLRYAFTGR